MKKKASIIGFGDVAQGDLCIGSCIIEALEQENMGEAIQLAFVGKEPRDADLWLYDIDFALIVGAVDTKGKPGTVRCWDLPTLQHHFTWFSQTSRAIQTLGEALVRANAAGGFPGDVILIWVEPGTMTGIGMTREMRKAFHKIIRLIKEALVKRQLLSSTELKVSTLYRLEVPPMVI
jgi:hydrogenase maturation protease